LPPARAGRPLEQEDEYVTRYLYPITRLPAILLMTRVLEKDEEKPYLNGMKGNRSGCDGTG